VFNLLYNSPSSTCTRKIFVCINFGKNGGKHAHRRQVDVAGGHGPTWPRRSTPSGVARPPMWPYHITDPWEGLQKVSPPLINVGLIQGPRWSYLGSMGPLSSTWRAPTDLQTVLLPKQPPYLPCNLHWGANPRRWKQRRCIQGPTDALGWPPTSLATYKYPLIFYMI